MFNKIILVIMIMTTIINTYFKEKRKKELKTRLLNILKEREDNMDLKNKVEKIKEKNYQIFLEKNQNLLEFLNEKILESAEEGKIIYEIPADTIENAYMFKKYYEELGLRCEIASIDFDTMILYSLKVFL